MKVTELSGSWTLRGLDNELLRDSCPALMREEVSFSMPADVHSILLDHHMIGDPYKGCKAQDSAFVTRTGWSMSTVFQWHREEGMRDNLILEGVDCLATVRLNGQDIGSCDNAFRRYIFPVTEALAEGRNILEIVFEPLDKVLDGKRKDHEGLPRQAMVRKSARHFGPYGLTPVGVYTMPTIVSDDTLLVESWNCTSRLVDHNWLLRFTMTGRAFRECEAMLTLEVAGHREEVTLHLAPRQKSWSHSFAIAQEDVAPWNPAGMGGAHIYPMSVSLAGFCDRRMIGFRTIEVDNSEDEAGRSFTILVNGERVFIKGFVWSGVDMLPGRVTSSRVIRALQSAVQAGFNAVRVHSSSAYESEVFYDCCDRLGLLVWQDFMFDEATYPQDEDFARSVEAEVSYQVLRLKSHPSLAVLCGGGEKLPDQKDVHQVLSYDRLNHGIVERCAKALAPELVYVPHAAAETLESTLRRHEGRSWGLSFIADGTDLEHIRKERGQLARFISSFSFPSLPSLSAVRGYVEEGEVNISADSMTRHQSAASDSDLIVSSILAHYRFPEGLEKMIYLSQLVQAEVVSRIVDRLRVEGPYSSGFFLKSLSSSWPAADESAIEYGGKWKMLMYRMRATLAPLSTICLRKGHFINILALNDSADESEVKVSLKFSSFKGDKLKMQVFRKVLPPHSLTQIANCDFSFIKDTRQAFAYVKLSTPEVYREELVLLDEPKRCHLCDPMLSVDLSRNGRNINCRVSCTHPAFHVVLDAGDIAGSFSDNLFSIRPTAQKIVSFQCEGDVDLEDFRKALRVYDLWWAGKTS